MIGAEPTDLNRITTTREVREGVSINMSGTACVREGETYLSYQGASCMAPMLVLLPKHGLDLQRGKRSAGLWAVQ
jgi:hypothetical protein